ncbi:lipoprotein N-acyltransferase Lnb domain-containing protein, partial [Photobacterium sp. R1]
MSAKTISLAYASENLMSPSSFMGHTFIKLSENETDPGHAVSFFTEVDGFNLPKIMFDSLVVGKEGYFIVSPYQESLNFYKDIE